MPTASPATSKQTDAETLRFPQLLKSWRKRRRLSQLDLALASGVSQRHVSFLESGRAQPSRSMVLRLSETLEVPLRDRNDWLTGSGFAPIFQARPLEDPQMKQVMAAVRMMLTNHEPFPAVAIDRAWNIRMANKPFGILSEVMGLERFVSAGAAPPNLLRLFFAPDGIKPVVANWAVIAPLLWRRAQREADALGGAEMKRVLAELSAYQDSETLWSAQETDLVPVLPLEIVTPDSRMSLFTMISTFGTPQDVTADELRIESLFPADQATESLFRGLAAGRDC